MYQVKRILVGLDLSEMDDALISYTSHLVKVLGFEKIYFLHVAKTLDLPDNVVHQYPDIVTPRDEAIEKEIKRKIGKFLFHHCPYEVEIREGNAEEKILRWSTIKEIDLIIMGRKNGLKGEGVLPKNLARSVHCSMLFVPENAKPDISRIMVPVDFSEASFLAFEEALAVTKATGAAVVLENTFEVPSGYHLSGKSYEEFADIMQGNAYKDAVNFVSRAKIKTSDVQFVFVLDKENDPAKKIYQAAHDGNIDLIVIGSKGRSGIASLFLGSVAEKMIHYDRNIPLMVVKDKKDNLGFLQALLHL